MPIVRRLTRADLAFLLGLLTVVPLLTWWLGWFPGFMSSDSIDQLGQVQQFEFANFHPAAHTISMWAVTRVWNSPGAVTLVQVLAMAVLLGVTARRLTQLGVPIALSVAAVWAASVTPMVGATTVTVWKDVPFTLAMVWAFTELLLMARDRAAFWSGTWGPLRLGTALGLMVMFRHNGIITAALVVLAVAIGFRSSLRRVLLAVAALIVVGLVVPGVVNRTFPVDQTTAEPAEVFMSDVAAVYVHEGTELSQADIALLAGVAPLEVWIAQYSCSDSTALVFHPEFNSSVVRQRAGEYRSLVGRLVFGHLPTVLGHRWCRASYLFVPPQPDDAFLHRPPFDIPANDLGYARDPISWKAFSLTRSFYVWAEPDSRLWLTWRPALMIWLGIITYGGIAWRRRLRPLLWAGSLIGAQLLNVAITSPAQEFRYAFGIWLCCLLSLPLWWLVVKPSRATLAVSVVDDRPANDARPLGITDRVELEPDGGEEVGEPPTP